MIAMTSREEVAKRLRVYATDFDFGDSNPLWYVEKSVFDDIEIREPSKVFNRLANLIDPTCKPVEAGSNIVCSGCGADLYDDDLYCSRCGARVVRD